MICLCAEALSPIDHTRSLDLVKKIKNSYLKNKALADIVRGLALTKYEEHKDLIYQIINEMDAEEDKVCALVWTIRVAPQLDSRSEPLERALKMADTFTDSEAREEILHAIGKAYAPLNCEKIEAIASEISDARLKIDLSITQARYSTSRDRVIQLLKEAISLVPQLGEQQKIGPLCDIAQDYALIDTKEAEALLKLAVQEFEEMEYDSRMMLLIVSAYAPLDYHKARSLVETTYANS